MELRRRSLESLSDADLDAWKALAATAAEPNPFFEPDLVVPAARHLAGEAVELLTIADDSRWVAALPVVGRRRYGRRLGRCLVAWLHPHCFVGAPLVAADAVEAAADALLAALGAPRLVLPRLPADAALAEALGGRARCNVLHSESRAVRRGDAPAGSALLSSRGRSEQRRRLRRLGEALGGEPQVSGGSVEELLELEHSGWKRGAGTSLLSRPGDAAFVRDIAPRLRILRLTAGGRTVAVASSIAAGGGHFLFKSAYDESLARFSAGQALAAATIDGLEGDIDSCAAPDNELVNALLPDRRAFVTLAVGRA